MSRHKIIGSEAFNRRPYVLIRSLRPGGLRRRRARAALWLAVGAAAGALAAAGAAVMVFGPALAVG